MALQHPYYAHGISTDELIKEAIEFCDEELDSFDGMEYDSDSEVCCQRSNTFIRELIRRLQNSSEIVGWQWRFKMYEGDWSDWNDGKVRDWIFDDGREYEERPVYAAAITTKE